MRSRIPSIPVITEANGTPANTVDYLLATDVPEDQRTKDGQYVTGRRITVHASISGLFITTFISRNGHTDEQFAQVVADKRITMINSVMENILLGNSSTP